MNFRGDTRWLSRFCRRSGVSLEVSRSKEATIFTLLWNLSAAIRGYLRFYMPTNRVIDWLRSPRGLKWAVPVTLVAVPTYLLARSVCVVLADRPTLGWLNLLVVLFFCYAAGVVMPIVTRSQATPDARLSA